MTPLTSEQELEQILDTFQDDFSHQFTRDFYYPELKAKAMKALINLFLGIVQSEKDVNSDSYDETIEALNSIEAKIKALSIDKETNNGKV